MTALCGGGTSTEKPAAALTISLSSTAVDAALALLGMPELSPVVGLALAGLQIATDLYCQGDPPAAVTLTQQDLNNLLDYTNPSTVATATDRVRQWFLNWYWCQVCECTSGQVPNCAKPNNPGSVSIDTGLPQQSNQPCFNGYGTATTGPTTTSNPPVDITSLVLPIASGPTHQITFGASPWNNPVTLYPMPSGFQSFLAEYGTLQRDPNVTVAGGAELAFYWYCTTDQTADLYTFTQTGAPDGSINMSPGMDPSVWPTKANYWGVGYAAHAVNPPGTGIQTAWLRTTFKCTGPALEPGCCPPDPSIDARLSAILQIVQNLALGTTSSNSFKPGPTHAGLSGSQLVSLGPTTIGVQLHIQNISQGWPSNPQYAPYYYSLGFVTPFAISYAMRGQRIIHNGQIFDLPAEADQVAVDLAPGLIADLVELLPFKR